MSKQTTNNTTSAQKHSANSDVPKPDTENAGDIQSTIQAAVLELMQSKDLIDITVTEAAQQAHISRTTFYRYYSSPQAVIDEIEDNFFSAFKEINRWAQMVRIDTKSSAPSPSMMARMAVIDKYRDALRIISGPHGDPHIREKERKILGEYLHRRLAHNFTNKVDEELFITFMTAGHFAAIELWINKRPDLTIQDLAEFTNLMFYAPFGVDRQ